MTSTTRNKRKQFEGIVSKKSGDKTISVTVQKLKRHALYGKVYKTTTKFLVHDEENKANVGDKVLVSSCRPLSRKKKWRLVSIHNSK